MCECLEYEDGSAHVCEACAGIIRDEHEQLEALRGFVERVASLIVYDKQKRAPARNQCTLIDIRDEAQYLEKGWNNDDVLF